MKKREELLNILFVEDDDVVARMHRFAVENLVENEVSIVRNGKEAIEYLENNLPSQKTILILLDLNMPIMNGWQFLDSLQQKEYSGSVYVVIVTSSSYNDDYSKSKNYDRVMGYYTKPLTRNKLLEILELIDQVSILLERKTVKSKMR